MSFSVFFFNLSFLSYSLLPAALPSSLSHCFFLSFSLPPVSLYISTLLFHCTATQNPTKAQLLDMAKSCWRLKRHSSDCQVLAASCKLWAMPPQLLLTLGTPQEENREQVMPTYTPLSAGREDWRPWLWHQGRWSAHYASVGTGVQGIQCVAQQLIITAFESVEPKRQSLERR